MLGHPVRGDLNADWCVLIPDIVLGGNNGTVEALAVCLWGQLSATVVQSEFYKEKDKI